MDSLLEQIERGTLWQFPGGVHPPQQKSLSNQQPIARLPLPDKLVLPLKQHIGANGQLLVNVGDKVLKGQALTKPTANWSLPVHAPTSGEVIEIKPMPSAHPSALPELSIVMTPDGNDTWCELSPVSDLNKLDHKTLIDLLHNAGIAGMGGAGFPTYVKADSHQPIEFLVVNGVECEPYITADDLLMREHAQEIVQGIEVMQQLLKPQRVLIGIEDNKPEAIAAMKRASAHNTAILVRAIPTKYPSGGEKQLIRVLTSKEVPSTGIPADIGVLVQNVGTLFAISEAIYKGKPLIERVVSVTGNTIGKPQNVWALIGTEIKHLLDCQGFTPVLEQRVVMGGPMMGFTLPTVRIPVIKTTNCILAPDNQELAEPGDEKACIRCSACADACPQSLLPQQLQWFAKSKDYDKLEAYNLFDCIECGACSYVCPSEIPLVQYYRVAKAEIREQKLDQIKAERAKERFEARKERLEREQQERQNRHKRSTSRSAKPDAEKAKVADALARVKQKQGDKSAVQAAIERAKAKKAADGSLEPDNSEVALERALRKEQARLYKEQKTSEDAPLAENAKEDSGKKDAVTAAIARAKAKKAAQQGEQENGQPQPQASEPETKKSDDDPRKAAVAAAIARAKAKKAAQQGEQENEQPQPPASEPETKKSDDDPRKAAVAAAIARAKAKKAAQQGEQENEQPQQPASESETPTSDDDDPRKAAVAAAIARAKAKKAAKQAEQENEQPQTSTSESETQKPDDDDPRKAAVAAAIARAKAKKAAKQAEQENEQPQQEQSVQDAGSTDATPQTPEQKRQAAIKAAVAKAKAKKQAKEQEGNDPS
ncbi:MULTISPECIES: electron transport complex subunit RsxC [Pseudoalteromonas]|uniref:Ion-translocating oxidoreductase complex subunit C n=1 Tax=Pseudoalteromonas amylolytica TaxID=1859457 RepID=A0A1S1MQH5_9GAMM|nr:MULTISPECIES: electron transport complex subunit RsxC [Pseudoalteromonas]OHU85810.1 electron transport complex subunit RsxC [Pseudoalteromonas sp. JW3]OHU87288.1 electron transport complex subunit RsxC [Pseudoalteromonas amylolytica]